MTDETPTSDRQWEQCQWSINLWPTGADKPQRCSREGHLIYGRTLYLCAQHADKALWFAREAIREWVRIDDEHGFHVLRKGPYDSFVEAMIDRGVGVRDGTEYEGFKDAVDHEIERRVSSGDLGSVRLNSLLDDLISRRLELLWGETV